MSPWWSAVPVNCSAERVLSESADLPRCRLPSRAGVSSPLSSSYGAVALGTLSTVMSAAPAAKGAFPVRKKKKKKREREKKKKEREKREKKRERKKKKRAHTHTHTHTLTHSDRTIPFFKPVGHLQGCKNVSWKPANHCNRSEILPSILLLELYLQTPSSLPRLTHTHTHTRTHTRTHTHTHTRARARAHTHTHATREKNPKRRD